jgi:two-component system, sensor histidine kinase and response regulator
MTRVLLVDDNATLLVGMTRELQLRGYTVSQAADGRCMMAALEANELGGQLPHIIISDITLPDMDATKIMESLKLNPAWQDIPHLFLTAFNSPNCVRPCEWLGVGDYIVKPFKMDDLVLAIESKLK